MAKKNNYTEEQKAILADLKKRSKKGIYAEIKVDIPYEVFEEFVSNVLDHLDYDGVEKTTDELMFDPSVMAEVDRQLSTLTYNDFIESMYGFELEYEDFANVQFADEIEAVSERLYREEEAQRLEKETALKVKSQIHVSNKNYEKAMAVLRAADLI